MHHVASRVASITERIVLVIVGFILWTVTMSLTIPFFRGFSAKMLYHFVIFPMRTTFPVHHFLFYTLILYLKISDRVIILCLDGEGKALFSDKF
jgi:hypothetical protein